MADGSAHSNRSPGWAGGRGGPPPPDPAKRDVTAELGLGPPSSMSGCAFRHRGEGCGGGLVPMAQRGTWAPRRAGSGPHPGRVGGQGMLPGALGPLGEVVASLSSRGQASGELGAWMRLEQGAGIQLSLELVLSAPRCPLPPCHHGNAKVAKPLWHHWVEGLSQRASGRNTRSSWVRRA